MDRGQEPRQDVARKAAMAAFASASASDLRELADAADLPWKPELLRGPETGLVTVRGRIGGGGAPFNTGEATVTRATVRLPSGQIGHAYALGRDKEKVRLAAILDASWCDEETRAAVEDKGRRAAAENGRPRRTPSGAPKPRRRRSTSSPWCAERTDGHRRTDRRTDSGSHHRRFRRSRLRRAGGFPRRHGRHGAAGHDAARQGAGAAAAAAVARCRCRCADALRPRHAALARSGAQAGGEPSRAGSASTPARRSPTRRPTRISRSSPIRRA